MANTIEGYLYSFGPSRQGGVYCILTFCVLSGRHFSQSRNKGDLVSLRSGILDVDHRIEDTGRQVVNGKILYTLRLYNVASAKKEVLVGAVSSEEIAEWQKAFTSSLGQPLESAPTEPWTPTTGIRLPFAHFGEQFVGDASPTGSPRLQLESPMFQRQREKSFTSLTTIGHESPKLERNESSLRSTDLQSADSGQASKWKLVRSENGLRFFQEATDFPFVYKLPVMKAVGVVKAPADQIFNLIMDYGPERQQWDHTLESASVIEVIDGHSDVLYIRLRQDWGILRPRDLCLARYWKREESGAYSVFYRSVLKQPLQAGYVRAYIHSGGYIVTPLKTSGSGKPRTLVESVLEMDAAGWSSLLGAGFSGYPTHLRDSLLAVVAGIREHVAAQRFNSRVTIIKRHLIEEYTDSLQVANHDLSEAVVSNAPFLSTSDDIEEFFDATMDQFSDSSESVSEPVLPSAELHKPLRIKIGSDRGTSDLSKFRGSLERGPLKGGKHSFAEPDSSTFLLKGINSLSTGSREPAGKSFCKLIGMDWFKSKDRMDHIAGRPRSHVQRACSNEGLFFFVINLQIPHTVNYSLVFYFVTDEEITEGSLLHRFISGDDTFRNSRFSLIPAIPEGSWIVRQAVGTKAVPLAQIVEAKYHVGFNYMEIDLNLGSSGVVRGVLSVVFGYLSALVVDMAFFIRGETADELPERLIGVGRCSHIQLDKAVELPASYRPV